MNEGVLKGVIGVLFCLKGLIFVPAMADETWPEMLSPPEVGGGEGDSAVVVGIENYPFVPKVPGARANADAWHEWLTRARKVPVGRVTLLRDAEATVENIRDAVARVASEASPSGTVWFVFIGHGAPAEDGKDGLLLGVDVQQTAKSLTARGLSRKDLVESLSKTKARSVRVVLDACFSGRSASGGTIVTGLQPLVVTTEASADQRFTIFTAAKGNQYAGPLPGTSRPAFSYLLLGGLRGWADEDGDGRVTAGELQRYTESALRAIVRDREQTPTLLGEAGEQVATSGGERGPDLAALARKVPAAAGGLTFEVTSLGAVPKVREVSAFDATQTGLDLSNVDVEGLEQYDRVVKLDRSDAASADKAKAWRDLAASKAQFREAAERRAAEWERRAEEERVVEEARKARKAAMESDWAKLSRLLLLEVISKETKREWASKFVAAYGNSWEENPYVFQLEPFLPAGAVRKPPEGWVLIPAGSFLMGSPDDEPGRDSDEGPVHRVRITRPFLLKATEVTQGEWRALMGNNPSDFKRCGDTCPVEQVSWWDAVAYCNALSRKEGLEECYELSGCSGVPGEGSYKCSKVRFRGLMCKGYRLPTEAEWEYAARAGTTTPYYTGVSLDEAAWYEANSGDTTHPVGKKMPNAFGLYDMLGNVWEWVWDWDGWYPKGEVTDPLGPDTGSNRVKRGGSWEGDARLVRAANRYRDDPGIRFSNPGFRPARSILY